MAIKIITGAAIVNNMYRDEAEAIEKALPVLVHHYAEATGLDIHHAEASLVETRKIDHATGKRSVVATIEVRVAGQTIASWREI